MKKYLSKKSLEEYKNIYKKEGIKSLLKKLGWKVFALVFIFYLIRDIILYIIGPKFLFDFFIMLGFNKNILYPTFIFLFISILIFFIYRFNKELKIKIFKVASFLGFLAILLGAFGAHGLKEILQEFDTIQTYKTASSYHFYTIFLMFFIGLMEKSLKTYYMKKSFLFALIGLFIFSGSLYLLSVTNIKFFGAFTPLGGLCLLISLCCLFFGFKSGSKN